MESPKISISKLDAVQVGLAQTINCLVEVRGLLEVGRSPGRELLARELLEEAYKRISPHIKEIESWKG